MQPKFIGPWDVAAQKNLKPFMLPEKAFQTMTNAYTFRGRVRKKPGYTLLGRLSRTIEDESLGLTVAAQQIYNFNLLTTYLANEPNAALKPGTVVITISTFDDATFTDNGQGGFTVTGLGVSAGSSINYVTGAVVIVLGPGVAVGGGDITVTYSYFPNLPVMGLLMRELSTDISINNEQTIAFDTRYAYIFILPNGWIEAPSTLPTVWTGDDYNFFWPCNYFKDQADLDLFWVTNNIPGQHTYTLTTVGGYVAGPPTTANLTTSVANNFQVGDTFYLINKTAGAGNLPTNVLGTVTVAGNPFTAVFPDGTPGTNGLMTAIIVPQNINIADQDGIRYYNGITWQNAMPATNTISFVAGCLIILTFKGRLLLLNTLETNASNMVINYPQRLRWCQNGTPLDFAQGWRDDQVGYGGFVNAATNERIVGAAPLKDEIIVYFEKSTWKIVYTGNDVLPFVWQRINAELGAESTFSSVRFDNGVVAVGNNGVHTTNGQSVARIDETIPDTVFQIKNDTEGTQRVYGIRDFYLELSYFTYPEFNPSFTQNKFPNKVLTYNYRDNCFSFFNESFTCYGYFQRTVDYIWATLPYQTWTEWEVPWNSGQDQARFNMIIAGNQQGFVMQLNPTDNGVDQTRYISSFSSSGSGPYTITVTSPDHNVLNTDIIYISGAIGITQFNGQVIQLRTTPTADTFTFQSTVPLSGTYLGGGVFEVLQNINIITKQFNPYWESGDQVSLVKADYLLDRTANGAISANVYVNMDNQLPMNNTDENITINPLIPLGSNVISTAPEVLYPIQLSQPQIWKRQYYQVIGDTFQLQLKMTNEQMMDQDRKYVNSSIILHGIVLHFEQSGTFL
jgi:hypothetical protein